MTGPVGFLEFFILEASDYVEQLDGLLLRGGTQGPDGEHVQRVARALRGTATMAKLPSFADLAAGIERVGRSMQDGMLRWDPGLGGVVVSAIDDLKILLRDARNWTPASDQRAAARAAELSRYAPSQGRPVPQRAGQQGSTGEAAPFLATEAANIAAGLELLIARSSDAGTVSNVLRRVRALRGVAGVKEITALADTLEATEDAARGVESGQPLSAEGKDLLASAADYLRTLSAALRSGSDVDAPSAARDTFTAAQERWTERAGERERVVPIAELFYADGQPGIVETSANPPTSAPERFRIELVSLGEHLRQVVDNAQGMNDPASAARARRDLRRALGAMQAAAESFGETEIAEFIAMHLPFAEHVDFLGLTALGDLATLVADPGTQTERLRDKVRGVADGHELSAAIGAGLGSEAPKPRPSGARNLIDAMGEAAAMNASNVEGEGQIPRPFIVDTPVYTTSIPFAPLSAPPPAPAPVAPRPSAPFIIPPILVEEPVVASEPAPPAPPAPEPLPEPAPPPIESDFDPVADFVEEERTSASLIDSGIAALESLVENPFGQLVSMPEEIIVPIEALLYRGRAALDRAIEVRDELRRMAPSTDREALEELFDLVELARAD